MSGDASTAGPVVGQVCWRCGFLLRDEDTLVRTDVSATYPCLPCQFDEPRRPSKEASDA